MLEQQINKEQSTNHSKSAPVGYKQTELGVIPSDWVSCEFQDVLTGFSSGMTPYRGNPEFYKGKIPWITSGELKYNIIRDTEEKITNEAVVKTNLKLLPVGTFLMAITGLEAAGTRGSCGVTGIEATTNQSCMALFPLAGKILTEYLYHFYVQYGNLLAFKFCQGTKQQSYTGKIAKILPINLPPTLKEQKAIATALSDVDALISNLEELITKKKAIKQGAMQQLLTPPQKGGKRLPGFNEEWTEKTLGEIIKLDKGEQLNRDRLSSSGAYPVINGGVEPSGYCEKWNRRENTITISEGGNSCGYVNLLKTKFWSGGHCYTLQLKTPEVNQQYLYLFLKYMENSIMSLRVGSGLPNIQKGRLVLFHCSYPIDVKEQKAIAEILSDMDTEIELLEIKKAKYQTLKQGMMQELLTGKTRLVN
ncbi:restriction endonuclease subunit S [Winogradskyella algicola]|uniref:restriction endonuclease subunit S n=1 Tax=Winogradskyella algicola TaxID=2575815 RepID=UPI0011091A3D|nr:restriction endonuclease subunit S [Winogradskyella algicola]